MAEPKSGRSKRKGKGSAAAAAPEPAPARTSLNDDDLQALAFQHKRSYETALATKKKAEAEFKNACKRAKAELGENAVETIRTMIEFETEEGEAAIKGRMERALCAARWMGASLGTQFDMFGAGAGEGTSRLEQGKRAGMAGDPCKPPADATADGQQEWIGGWHAGNDARNKNLAAAVGGDGEEAVDKTQPGARFGTSTSPLRQTIEEGDAHIKSVNARLGTEPPTHHIAG